MRSKGIFGVGLTVVTMFLVITIAAIGIQRPGSVENRITEETLPLAASKLGNVVYMVDAVEKAEVEVRFRGEYILERGGRGEKLLKYRTQGLVPGGGKAVERITSRAEFEISEGGESDRFCVVKNSGETTIRAGGC